MPLLTTFSLLLALQGTAADEARAGSLRQRWDGKYESPTLQPHWSDDGQSFWLRRRVQDGLLYEWVESASGERQPAFDTAGLAEALSAQSAEPVDPRLLQVDSLQRVEGSGLEFDHRQHRYRLDTDGGLQRIGEARASNRDNRRGRRNRGRGSAERSPDGAVSVEVRDHDLHLVLENDERRLTDDGSPDRSWRPISWAPDSQTLLAARVEVAERGKVYTVQSSPKEGGRAVLRTKDYALPGDPCDHYELWLFDLDGEGRPAQVPLIDFGRPRPIWRSDASLFLLEVGDRGHRRTRIHVVDPSTGSSRLLVDEDASTYALNGATEGESFVDGWKRHLTVLGDAEGLLWTSERSGWNHLYHYDVDSGACRALSAGEWVVRGVDQVDEERGLVWFRGAGRNPGEDPYFQHWYRVGLDGRGLCALTEGDGDHEAQFSPDRRYLIDTWSSIDRPPVVVLRSGEDGRQIAELARGDDTELRAAGWAPPQPFHAKGRDGETDIWGWVVRPLQREPGRRYPVIEHIYAGPHGAHVPKTFRVHRREQELAELGFVVVRIDGMGTSWRSKRFHDVCWKNLADAGFPDRKAWMQALAATEPCVDLDRVGIYGTSAGGQNAAGAVLFHPEFYDVAVASCGCHDNRMDKASWNEQWMGAEVGPHYAASSNIEHATKLQGRLMLLVGELDTNVPPESTYRFAHALIAAGKDFELVLLPGVGHSDGGAYGERRRRDFFVRHLLGVEPPERNR